MDVIIVYLSETKSVRNVSQARLAIADMTVIK